MEVARVNKCIPLPMTEEEPVVDSMLGWLARWLRMLGVRASYDPNFSDESLLTTNHLLITRDRGLFSRRVFPSLLLETSRHVEWLSAVSLVLGIPLRLDMERSLCPVCGSRLVKVGRDAVADKVPRRVLAMHDTFWLCVGCGKVYWVGSHHVRIGRELSSALGVLGRLRVSCVDGNLLIIRE